MRTITSVERARWEALVSYLLVCWANGWPIGWAIEAVRVERKVQEDPAKAARRLLQRKAARRAYWRAKGQANPD